MSIQSDCFEIINDSLLQRTMIPYANKGSVYLKLAYTNFKIPSAVNSISINDTDYVVRGQFSIHESCYINDTGHFNAVEFNICYNQLMYTALAYGVSNKLLNCLQDITLDDYYNKQLSDIYITRLESYYKRMIDPNNFSGIFRIKKVKKTRKLIFLKTEIEFSDDGSGFASGEVDIAIT